MTVLAVANQKGGSGKTTTAVNLAAALGERGRRVLVVDLDPQGSASWWLGSPDDDGSALLEALQGGAPLPVVPTEVEGVELAASGPELAAAEEELEDRVGSLRGALDRLQGRPWDVVLLDCPPTLGRLLVAALGAADAVLVPVEASPPALRGLSDLLDTIEHARGAYRPDLRLLGLVACRVDARTKLGPHVVAEMRADHGDLVFRTEIPEAVAVREAWGWAKPVTVYAPQSPASEAHRHLADEIEGSLR